MRIYKDFPINNSLQIKSISKFYVEVTSINDFDELYKFIKEKKLPTIVLGEGTNIVPCDYFNGISIKPLFNDIDFHKNYISAGSSVNWHKLVSKTIENNIYGFENLSLIPGSVGAAPIQNIGAYGQEVSNLILKVYCFDIKTGELCEFLNEDCMFSYRNSFFKNNCLMIYKVDFRSDSMQILNLEYKSIQEYLKINNLNENDISLSSLSEIVCEIRNKKLPNPKKIPNAGSFFKNPIVRKDSISQKYFSIDDLIIWSHNNNNVKVGSARLIELIKEEIEIFQNVEIYEKHSLILVTKSQSKQDEVLRYANLIQSKVLETFNINLEIEPIVIRV